MLVGNSLYRINIAYIPINMHRQNGASPICNKFLYYCWIQSEVIRFDISKNWLKTFSDYRMGRGDKSIRRCNYLIALAHIHSHGFQNALERRVPIYKKRCIGNAKIGVKRFFELLVQSTPIGKPTAFPKRPNLFAILLKFRH